MIAPGTNIFEDVTIGWKGVEYRIPAKKGMRLAYTVEMALRQDSRLSVFELMQNPPITTLAMAYGAALRFAGAVVSDDEVYLALTASVVDGTDDAIEMRSFINNVFAMLMPPAVLRGPAADEGGDDAKKTTGG